MLEVRVLLAVALSVAALSLGAARIALAGVLDEARSAVRASGGGDSDSDDDDRDDHYDDHYHGYRDDCDDDCDPAGDLIGHCCGLLLDQLFTQHTPHAAYGAGSTALEDYFFLSYPYQRGLPGYLISEYTLASWLPPVRSDLASAGPEQAAVPLERLPPVGPRPPRSRGAAVRLWLDYGNDFDDLTRYRAGFLLQSCSGPAIEAEWHSYLERMPAGNDRLHLGEVNGLFRIFASERQQWFWGVGLSWLDDEAETNLGYNLTLKTDIFPVRPFVLSGEVDYGEIGRAHVLHLAATIGVVYRHYELFGGYDYRAIESAELQGPLVGLRLWY